MLNGASFYFSFCPATLLLSHWFLSCVTKQPTRVAPDNELIEIEVIQHRTDAEERPPSLTEAKASENNYAQGSGRHQQPAVSDQQQEIDHVDEESASFSDTTPATSHANKQISIPTAGEMSKSRGHERTESCCKSEKQGWSRPLRSVNLTDGNDDGKTHAQHGTLHAALSEGDVSATSRANDTPHSLMLS